jgi:hypothetical protein
MVLCWLLIPFCLETRAGLGFLSAKRLPMAHGLPADIDESTLDDSNRRSL